MKIQCKVKFNLFGGLVSGFSQLFATAPAAVKYNTHFKRIQ